MTILLFIPKQVQTATTSTDLQALLIGRCQHLLQVRDPWSGVASPAQAEVTDRDRDLGHQETAVHSRD